MLNEKQRSAARKAARQAAMLGINHAKAIHYTQGRSRWQGIADTRYAAKGEFPNYSDCSAFATWCLWNGLYVLYRQSDVVNGANWRAGYTGTMLQHGRRVGDIRNILLGDLVIYGRPGSVGSHVAIVVQTGVPQGHGVMVASHGSEGGPYYIRYNYRSDIQSIRRYI
jgi:cell wall-associated NlpC family hydrolase